MKKKHLFLLLTLIVVSSSSVVFRAGYNDSAKTMMNVFETSKAIVADQLPKESKNKFAYLTDSHVKNLGSGRYEVDSYVDCQNYEKPVRRIQYTMIVHWNGQRYALDDLTSEGVIKQ